MSRFAQMFGVQLIDREVVSPSGGLPAGFPPEFATLTEPTEGNTCTYDIYESALETAGEQEYGGPAKRVSQKAKSQKSVILPHAIEEIGFKQSILNQIASNNGQADTLGRREIGRQVGEFVRRFDNRRKAMIMSALAHGAIYTDGDRILPSSSGATRTIDLGVPAANKDTLGGIIDVTWDNTAAKIGTQIENIQAAAAAAGNPPIEFAGYAGSITDFLQGNAIIAKMVAGGYGRVDFTTGVIKDMFGLTWYPLHAQFIKNASGTAVNPFAKKVVFHPKVTRTWYEMREGSYVVGPGGEGQEIAEILARLEKKYGMFGYAKWGGNPRTVVVTAGDTAMPVFYIPNAIFIATVLP